MRATLVFLWCVVLTALVSSGMTRPDKYPVCGKGAWCGQKMTHPKLGEVEGDYQKARRNNFGITYPQNFVCRTECGSAVFGFRPGCPGGLLETYSFDVQEFSPTGCWDQKQKEGRDMVLAVCHEPLPEGKGCEQGKVYKWADVEDFYDDDSKEDMEPFVIPSGSGAG